MQCLSELRALLGAAGSSEPFIAVLQALVLQIRNCWEKLTFHDMKVRIFLGRADLCRLAASGRLAADSWLFLPWSDSHGTRGAFLRSLFSLLIAFWVLSQLPRIERDSGLQGREGRGREGHNIDPRRLAPQSSCWVLPWPLWPSTSSSC